MKACSLQEALQGRPQEASCKEALQEASWGGLQEAW